MFRREWVQWRLCLLVRAPKSLNAVLEHVLQKFTIGGEQNMAHKFQKSFCNIPRLYKKKDNCTQDWMNVQWPALTEYKKSVWVGGRKKQDQDAVKQTNNPTNRDKGHNTRHTKHPNPQPGRAVKRGEGLLLPLTSVYVFSS